MYWLVVGGEDTDIRILRYPLSYSPLSEYVDVKSFVGSMMMMMMMIASVGFEPVPHMYYLVRHYRRARPG